MYSLILKSLVLALCVAGSPVSPHRRNDDGSKRAVYILDNDPEGCSIISIAISEDGRLSSPTRTYTQGKGLLGLDSPTKSAGPDSLFGQDAVLVEGNVCLMSYIYILMTYLMATAYHDSSFGKMVANIDFAIVVSVYYQPGIKNANDVLH